VAHKETFDQYVLSKLTLIHGLDLLPRDVIHLVIGGIVSAPVRAAALSLTTEIVEDFVDKMRNIAESCLETDKKTGSANKIKIKQCRNCDGFGHAHQDCRKKVKCFFCKKTGHRQYDCPAAKDKGRIQPTQQRTPSTPAVVTEDGTSVEPIAYVAEPVRSRLELNESSVVVDSIQEQDCNLVALMDTGSSISFIKCSIYLAYCKYFACEIRPTNRKFVNIKDLPLEVIGKVKLTMSLLKHKRCNFIRDKRSSFFT